VQGSLGTGMIWYWGAWELGSMGAWVQGSMDAGCVPISEVKNAARVRPEDLRGLKAFAADYPLCEPVLLYRGT